MGRMVLIVDDEDRENEGDIAVAAQFATPEAINFMAAHGRGLICMPMLGERLDQLQIPLMVAPQRPEPSPPRSPSRWMRGAASPPASRPYDRYLTVQALIDPSHDADDIAAAGPPVPAALRRRRRAAAGRATPRRRWIWPSSPGCTRRPSSARS